MKKSSGIVAAFLAVSLLGAETAQAEYNGYLSSIHRVAEQKARANARSQGKLVADLVTGFVDTLVSIAPYPERVGEAASVSLASFPEYAGTAIGGWWQSHAEKQLLAKSRASVASSIARANAALSRERARIAAKADYAAKQREILEQRAQTYGPDKPNAFY